MSQGRKIGSKNVGKRKDRFTENGQKKLCTGFVHRRKPVFLPISQFTKVNHGKSAGSVMSECRMCRAVRLGRNPNNIFVFPEIWEPVAQRLVEFFGSKRKVSAALGKQEKYLTESSGRPIKYFNFKLMLDLVKQKEDENRNDDQLFLRYGEPEIVDPEPFGSVLRKFCKDWLVERPRGMDEGTGRQGGWNFEARRSIELGVYFMGPVDWLAQKTGIDPRRIGAFSNGEIPRVPLSQADAILTAMHRQEMLAPGGEIKVKPNPQWSMEKYVEYMQQRGCI